MALKSKKEIIAEQQLKGLAKLFESRGMIVRREKLSRGYSYRVKSGECQYVGKNHVFVDRRLPSEQQISILLDALVDSQLELAQEEVEQFPPHTKKMLETRGLLPAA